MCLFQVVIVKIACWNWSVYVHTYMDHVIKVFNVFCKLTCICVCIRSSWWRLPVGSCVFMCTCIHMDHVFEVLTVFNKLNCNCV